MFLLASDYDNTLNTFGYDLKINLFFLRKFRNEGNLFLLNTERSYKSMKREINKYKIPFDYLSCNDGNILFNKNGKVLYNSSLSMDLFHELERLKKKFKIEINPIFFQGNILEFELVVFSLKEIFWLELEKIMLKYNLSYKLFKKCGGYSIYVYGKNISKSTPILYLREKYGLNEEKIYTIGDHYNDIEMIRDYNGYAMLWAKQEVKEVSLGSCLTVASLVRKIGKRR